MSNEEQKLKNYASVIRDMIQHENLLTNQRLTWMIVLEGILFAGAASFWKLHWAPLIIIAGLGIVTAFSVWHSLWLSGQARRHFRIQYEKKLQESPELASQIAPVVGDIPNLINLPWANPWKLIPWSIIVAWMLLVISAILFADGSDAGVVLE